MAYDKAQVDNLSREVTHFLMHLEDRVMANKVYDLLVILNTAGQTLASEFERQRETSEQLYEQLLDAERKLEPKFYDLLLQRLEVLFAQAPHNYDGIEWMHFYEDGSGGTKSGAYWDNLTQFVDWLRRKNNE